jgi:hypothetical protein
VTVVTEVVVVVATKTDAVVAVVVRTSHVLEAKLQVLLLYYLLLFLYRFRL